MAGKNLGTLTIDLVAKVGGFLQGMTAAERAAKKAAEGSSAAFKKSAKDIESSNNQIVSSVKATAGAIGAAFTVSKIVGYTEAYTTLNNRLLLVTNGSKEFSEAQKSIIDIAQNNRQGLSETAELYQRLATNQKELGLTGQEVAAVVDTISKTMVISGASAQAASGALIQLGQAFASGTLRGQELNSVMEQAPALAKAIADGLNIPIGKLREVSQAGELSADAVIKALQKQAAAVEENFGKMQATIGQSMEVLNNSLIVAVGEFDKATGASAAFAGAVIGLAESIESLARNKDALDAITDAVVILGLAIGARLTAPVLTNAAAFALAQKEAIRYQMALATMAGVSRTTAAGLGALTLAARGAGAAMAVVGGPVGLALLAASAIAYFAMSSDDAAGSAGELAEKVDYLNMSFSGFTKNQALAAIQGINDQLQGATFRALDAGDAVRSLEQRLQMYPNDARAQEWNRALVKARAEFDGVNQEVAELNAKLNELNGIIGNLELEGAAQAASKTFTELSAKINEQIILHGKNTEAAKLEAQIQNGLITGLLEGEAGKLLALAKTRDAQIAATEAEKKRNELAKTAAREAQAAAKKRADEAARAAEEIEGEISALERAAKVWGMSADEVKIYDLRIQGASESQLEYAQSLLDTVAAFEQQKELQEDYKGVVESLRTEEEQRLDTLREQLQILNQMGDTKNRDRAIGGAFENAPEFEGAGDLGGFMAEFDKYDKAEEKLSEWNTKQLDMLRELREEKLITDEEYNAKELEIKQQHEDAMAGIERARFQTGLESASSFFGELAALQNSENSKARALGKAAAIAQATIKTYEAANSAYAAMAGIPVVGPALGAVAAGAAIAAGMANVAAIKGQAHDGIMSVPSSGTWNLEKGERVLPQDTAARLDRTLADIQYGTGRGSGSGRGGVVVNQTIQTTGRIDRRTSEQMAADTARKTKTVNARGLA